MLDRLTFAPKNFVIIDGVNYFRLEDGRIATENPDNVVIDLSKKDEVCLLTFVKGENIVSFWEVDCKLYALAAPSCVELPMNIVFMDIYSSGDGSEGLYVKYKYLTTNACGIIYVSETEVRSIISYEEGYADIYIRNGMLYIERKDGEKKFMSLR